MMAIITVISGILIVLAALIGYVNKKTLEYIFWLISGISFLIIGVALLALNLDALALPVTIYLGSLYPSFLALGILKKKELYWREFLGFIILMLVLILIGDVSGTILKTVAQIILHAISGLIIVFLPIYFVLIRKDTHYYYLLFSLGGLVIGIGGLALASIQANKPILPLDLVILLLHPLLFLSAFLIAAAIYLITTKVEAE